MRAASLFAVLVLAHLLTMAGHPVPLSIWTPIAYLWQDLLVALIFAALDALTGHRRAGWIAYAVLVAYVAVNVPVSLVLSSPLTPTMMRATGGALQDSILHHLTFVNVGALALIATSGLVFPLLFTRMKLRTPKVVVFAAILVVIAGPFAVARVDTIGLHRNAFVALLPVRGVHTAPPEKQFALDDWRTSPFASAAAVEDLSNFRGSAARRNVVLVILESTAAGYLRPYGAAEDPMPNFTQLASQSIVFENAYAVYPESIKGLFSTLCSRYPAFDTPAEEHIDQPCPSVAQLAADAGYHTALFHSGRFMYLGMQAMIQGRGFGRLEDAGDIGGVVNSSFGVDEPSTVDRILSWIDSLPRDEPFFVTYLPIAGHHPYATPEPGPFSEDTELGRYRNALHYGDAALAQLIQGLRDRSLEEKTLYVIFGDHGEAFGQHPLNSGHSLFIYDENVRVPYVIAAPGLIAHQIRVRRIASLIDTAPTVLDFLGIPLSPGFQGSSLLAGPSEMALFFTDYSIGWLGLRDACWKYIYDMDSRRSKLFDVCVDPGELDDKSRTQPERVRIYRSNLEQWIRNRSAPVHYASMGGPDD